MESTSAFRCPSCHSDKYTSLPFGNVIGIDGSACTYRCLKCGAFFSTRAPVHRALSKESADNTVLVQPAAHVNFNLLGSRQLAH